MGGCVYMTAQPSTEFCLNYLIFTEFYIQRRTKGKEGDRSPYEEKGWSDYKKGFGKEKEENFWIGLEKLHRKTSIGHWDVTFTFSKNDWGTASFTCHNFTVESEMQYYRLNLKDCGDFIHEHGSYANIFKSLGEEGLDDRFFTTKDWDTDPLERGNCAEEHKGGFWYGFKKNVCTEFGHHPPTAEFWDQANMVIKRI